MILFLFVFNFKVYKIRIPEEVGMNEKKGICLKFVWKNKKSLGKKSFCSVTKIEPWFQSEYKG